MVGQTLQFDDHDHDHGGHGDHGGQGGADCGCSGACDCDQVGPIEADTTLNGTGIGSPLDAAAPINTDLVDQLNGGWAWSTSTGQVASTITYGAPTSNAFASPLAEAAGWSTLNAQQQATMREAIQVWDDLIATDFVETNGNTADIKFSNTTSNIGYAHAYSPSIAGDEGGLYGPVFGSVWLNNGYNAGTNDLVTPESGDWGYMTYIHEIGHALGLDHAGNYNGGSPRYGDTSTGWLYAEDSIQYTVMSYFGSGNTGAIWNNNYAQTPMVYDILAIQQLYGAETTTRTGDTVYGFNATDTGSVYDFSVNGTPILTIWDAGGQDTLDVSNYRNDQVVDLNDGAYSSVGGLTSNVAIAYDATIENAHTGAGHDRVNGNEVANTIQTGAGKDFVNAGAGDDILSGGTSNDTLFGEAGNDHISGGKHKDYLYGGDGDDHLEGGTGDDYLYGEDGNDFIEGQSGIDRIWGGAGNDTIEAGSGDDKIYGSEGDDLIVGGSGYDTLDFSTFDAPVEVDMHAHTVSGAQSGNDELWGVERVWGTAGDDSFKGDKRDNDFRGGDGNDDFRGLGGADTFKGGRGTDTYTWYAKDVVRDGTFTGMDTIIDFSVGQDILELEDFFEVGIGQSIDDFVRFVDDATGTTLQAVIDGFGFADVVHLDGLDSLTATSLIEDSSLLA
ncbi:MAG: M10 family metallopeptidase [Pseudomonadota bacterium]